MRLTYAVRTGAWLLVGLNLLLALGAIGLLTRMTPAIAQIIERNGHSIRSCEDLLTLFALTGDHAFTKIESERAQTLVAKIRGNITEPGEPVLVEAIERDLAAAFRGERGARAVVIEHIAELSRVNQAAMAKADHKAQQLGQAGAWGVVFMAVAAFLAGLFFIHGLNRRIVIPIEEIHAVLRAHRTQDIMRRCSGTDLPQEMQAVFMGLNELLDQCQALGASSGDGDHGRPQLYHHQETTSSRTG